MIKLFQIKGQSTNQWCNPGMFYIRGLPPERTNISNWGYRQTLPRGLPSERINTSNWGYRQTLPRGLPSERTNTSNWGHRQTLPRGLPSERTNTSNWRYRQTLPEVFHQRGPTHPTEEDRQTLLRRLPSERTKTSNRGGYRQTLLRGLPSDQTTTKPQEIKRENLDTTSKRNQQWQTREYQTDEQNTSIKVKYCKTVYLIRWFIVKTS